jgi:HEAT repeat protein
VVDRHEIADLIDRLNHPADDKRREVMRQLVEYGEQAVPVLEANLRFVEPEVRPALIRVIGEIGDDRALLPLMRFVFDTQGEPRESDARGFAMQAIMRIADQSHTDKLFDFLVDMKDDQDTFVRGYVIEAFGRLGDRRATPFVEDALEDSDDFVRECAQRAMDALEDSDSEALSSKLDGRELLQKIRISNGSELDYYMKELAGRDDAFELAVQLIREDDRDTMRGLRVLQKLDDPRARQVARRQYQSARSDATRAVCLRLLGKHLEGDASDNEVELLRRGLKSSDPFIGLAALRAAGKSGNSQLMRQAIEAIESTDLSRAETAAQGLAEGFSPDTGRMIPDLLDAFHLIHRHRRNDDAPEYPQIEAYLLRALERTVRGVGVGTSDAREAALVALSDAENLRPVLVNALRLLDRLVAAEGLPPHERWNDPAVESLLKVLQHSDETIARKALELTDRAVAGDAPDLSDYLDRVVYEQPDILLEHVIPLLERAGDERARELLDELTNHNDGEVQEAAEQALRRVTDSDTTIDVDYE